MIRYDASRSRLRNRRGLGYYVEIVPTAKVTGIDLPVEENAFDAAVSVESLHHFTQKEKIPLYTKLRKALNPEGYFILTDYFAKSAEDEALFRAKLNRMKREQNIPDWEICHYDTPLTL